MLQLLVPRRANDAMTHSFGLVTAVSVTWLLEVEYDEYCGLQRNNLLNFKYHLSAKLLN